MSLLIVGGLVAVVVLVAVMSAFERGRDRRLDAGLAKLTAHLRDVTREDLGGDHTIRGTLRGLPLVVRLSDDGEARSTSVQCTRAIDDRFTIDARSRDGSLAVTTTPNDLARSVFDEALRAALLAFRAPVVRTLETHELELVCSGLLGGEAAVAACDLVVGLVERALMCARPS